MLTDLIFPEPLTRIIRGCCHCPLSLKGGNGRDPKPNADNLIKSLREKVFLSIVHRYLFYCMQAKKLILQVRLQILITFQFLMRR